MSGIRESSLHPSTVESMRLNDGRCGCEQRGGKWWLCQYHQGYDDGASAPLHRSPIDVPCPNDCERFGGKVPGHIYGSNWDWVPCQTCGGTSRVQVAS